MYTKFELCNYIRSTDMKGAPIVRNHDPVPLTFRTQHHQASTDCRVLLLFVEFSAGIRQGYPVAPCVPPETEADPVQRLFCQLNLAFDGLLVLFRL